MIVPTIGFSGLGRNSFIFVGSTPLSWRRFHGAEYHSQQKNSLPIPLGVALAIQSLAQQSSSALKLRPPPALGVALDQNSTWFFHLRRTRESCVRPIAAHLRCPGE